MTGKYFKIIMNERNQYDIMCKVEDELWVYNDLGVYPFSAAPALYDLLNQMVEDYVELEKENKQLRKENYGLQDGLDYYKEENVSLNEKIDDLEFELEALSDTRELMKQIRECKEKLNI